MTIEIITASRLAEKIIRFVRMSSDNSLHNESGEPAWGAPLVGFARGDDQLFAHLKTDIGPFYWTPEDIFQLTFPDLQVSAADLAVVCWILPQTAATKEEHRQATSLPAERWSRSRLYGEQFNDLLRRQVVLWLQESVISAIAPLHAPQWQWQRSPRYGLASNWSERHAAHVAGLGTFGLSDGLITPVGKAMRCGSVVALLPVEPATRPYASHVDYCLYYTKGTCGACIDRCPAGAISKNGHDKERCLAYIKETTAPYAENQLGEPVSSCGLCQVKIPCESKIPAASGQTPFVRSQP
ncbi:MAG: 4Fe-4S ferredoxin [Deltaproteobacteria bacterium]|nr:4Fe-4S ferredoxin [Candidatus Anaeroferrophillus wilburensis]MBN2887949.1 4Fe-4S ferredoxin [Deltaproteobacteria bacterium]